jgi:hypothetical protein
MPNKSRTENKTTSESQVNKILDKLCLNNESEAIEEDIVALFEDIIKLFVGREEEFLNFENLSKDAKNAIYVEIKNIIALLKQLRGAKDKDAVMQMLSKNLMDNCSNHAESFKSISEQLNAHEQKNIKRRFADAILLELYRQRQIYIAHEKPIPKTLNEEIEKYVGQMKHKLVAPPTSKRSHAERIVYKKKMSPDIKPRDF